jgi:peptidyl-prolyl cis-trans isomerase D
MSKTSKVKLPKEMTRKHLARAQREARQQRLLLIGITVAVVAVIGLIGYGILDQRVLQPRQPVADVNGTIITTAEFQSRVRYTRAQINSQISQLQAERQQFASDPSLSYFTQQIDQQLSSLQSEIADPVTLGSQVINTMVGEVLIRQEAAKRGISVPPADVRTAIEQQLFNYYRVPPTPTPEPTASPTPLVSPTPLPTPTVSITPTATPEPTFTPEPTATPVSEQAFNTMYNNYLAQLAQYGMTKDDLSTLMETSLLRTKLIESFGKDIPTTVEQVEFHYLNFETEQGAQTAETQLKSGVSFDDLYQQVQAGQVVSATGSLLSWTPTDELTQTIGSEFGEVVNSLSISQTSQIVTDTTSSGYFIFQLDGRMPLALTTSQIQSREQTAFQDWLNSQISGPGVNLYNDRYADRVPTS